MYSTPDSPQRATSAEATPLPRNGGVDERTMKAWREWLGALTTDAEAALAAALAYEQLDGEGRDSWIDALAEDADQAAVPRFAAYAPLLAVELNDARRMRIRHAIGDQQPELIPNRKPCAFAGQLPKNVRLSVVVRPLYLDFVQVVACAFRPGIGFDWVKHDPIVGGTAAPKAGDALAGALLEKAPLKAVIDELAHTVLAHQRHYDALPEALRTLADLFVPSVDA